MRREADFVMQRVAGEHLLVPTGAQVMNLNGLITLNETAAFIWDLLREDQSSDELVAAVVARYYTTQETAREDVRAFLAKLGALGLIET
jgi:hypothetical protein